MTLPRLLSAISKIFDGTLLITGPVVSCTVTLKVAGAEVDPPLSLAVQLTVEVPISKTLPDTGRQVTVGLGSTLSDAVGNV